MSGSVHYSVEDSVASVVFDRPEARNAMTWDMYDALGTICEQIAADRGIRAVTFRGAGGQAFVAGTDMEQFRSFKEGGDGLAYEAIIDRRIAQIESLPVPTVAIVEGWAIGGGMAIASVCDFRIATKNARFGIPIARTLGNCLSMANMTRIIAALGMSRTKRMLMLAELMGAEDAKACGFVLDTVEPDKLEETLSALLAKLKSNAPITMRVVKESARRIIAANIPNGDDLIRECYGSRDFKIGVEAFLAKTPPAWSGR